MLYVDGWDGMVIIVHRSFKSTFGANKCSDNKGCSCGELVHFCHLAPTSLSPKSRPEKRWGGHQELPSFLQSSSKSLPFGSWVQPLPSAIVFASIFPYNSCCPYSKKIKYKKSSTQMRTLFTIHPFSTNPSKRSTQANPLPKHPLLRTCICPPATMTARRGRLCLKEYSSGESAHLLPNKTLSPNSVPK